GHRVSGAPGVYVRLDDPFSHARLARAVPPRSISPSPQPSPAAGRGSEAGQPPLPPAEGADEGAFAGLGKIAALGVKVSRRCAYHGVALNVAMDLEPFSRINPCGYAGLQTVDLSTIGISTTWNEAAQVLGHELSRLLAT
ncbi:MAG TPA: lipoyl(octanoyl) transferase, partial [Ramlibacter sp.]|nr:lipoyl(octanoyl) transferase [Ramlibacter sp.]